MQLENDQDQSDTQIKACFSDAAVLFLFYLRQNLLGDSNKEQLRSTFSVSQLMQIERNRR